MDDDIEGHFFKVKAMTIKQAMDLKIRRVFDPNWAEKDCYLKLPLKVDDKYPPWLQLYSEETQKMMGIDTPQHILWMYLLGGLESICLEYKGPISQYDHD